MSTVENGVIKQLSVSQVESFDHEQTGGCQRKYWFERAQGIKPEETKAQDDGTKGHDLLATYFKTGKPPEGRVRMGKHVRAAIVKGELPAPGDDMIVEARFSGQEKFDAAGNWIPLDKKETLHLGGVPWDGFIDLAFRRGDVPEIWDHKFSSDPDTFAKPASRLVKTVQMPVYVLSQIPYWPDAKQWRLVHHYVKKSGIHSFLRHATVSLDEVLERKAQIETVVEQMKAVAAIPFDRQDDVPANASGPTRACESYAGCPFQSSCSEFKRRQTMAFQLSEEQKKMFEKKDATVAPAPTAGSTSASDDPFADDEIAAMEAKLAAAKAAKASPLQAKPRLADVFNDVQPPPEPKREETAPLCACGTQMTPENASKLRDGNWKHIGCANELPLMAASEPPKPKERKKKTEPVSPTTESGGHDVPKVAETKTVEVVMAPADPVLELMGRQTAALESIAKLLAAVYNR